MVVFASAAAPAQEPVLFSLPVDCAMGANCVIQNYVDMAPGPEALDHTCGSLTYDGHDGIDIRVPTYKEMREGVPVVAAAKGVARAVRDGMADISVREGGEEALAGRKAGNGVVVIHGGGWETQYSHLQNGSIAVKRGDRVERGQKLGNIGLSGFTEFPHVEFSVRYKGEPVDPFTGLTPEAGCGETKQSLWRPEARQQLAYQAGGLLAAGFADRKPIMTDVFEVAFSDLDLTPDSEAVVFWALTWGLRQDDRWAINLQGPEGEIVAEQSGLIPRHKAQWFKVIGRKRPAAGWPAGRYRGSFRVERAEDGEASPIIDIVDTVEVR